MLSTDAVCLSERDVLRHLELHTEGAVIIMGAGGLDGVKRMIVGI
jgi:hypothetical protein